MNWLNDEKNKPIVIGILVVVIVGAGLAVWLMNRGPSESAPPETTVTSESPTEPAVKPEAEQPAPAAPSSVQPAATTTVQPAAAPQMVAVKPMEAWRSDPFLPLNYKPPRGGPKPTPPIPDLPIFRIPVGFQGPPPVKPDLLQPPRRMAGLLMSDRVYAIIESNGKSEIVQPGDTLSDRLAVVERIERDRVVLKTVDAKPKYLIIRMAASTRVESSPSPSAPRNSRPGRDNYNPENEPTMM